jgi:ABC-type dipeptide/oligopeptide/nickel transport system permease component
MGRYLARRLVQAAIVFAGATLVIYGAVFLIPGNPFAVLAGGQPLPATTMHDLDLKYHLNEPFLEQYGRYLYGLAHGDFGTSISTGQSVASLLGQAWPVTVTLALTAWAIEIVLGLGSGIAAALRPGGVFDRLVLFATILAVSVPVFVLAFTAQALFGVRLHWLPVAGTGSGWPVSYLLPAAVLALGGLATASRLARASLLEALNAEYVRMAVAKGLPRRWVVGKHALRNSIIPVITYLSVDLGYLLGGAVVIEGVFNLPGVGLLIFNAVQQKDGAVVVGVTTLLIGVFMLGNLVIDLLYALLDPRIRYQ